MSPAYREELISAHQMNNVFIPCMNIYFAFVTVRKTEKISVKISYALWFLVELAESTPWAVICSIYIFFFFLLNYQVKIQLFLMVLTLCVSHSHI